MTNSIVTHIFTSIVLTDTILVFKPRFRGHKIYLWCNIRLKWKINVRFLQSPTKFSGKNILHSIFTSLSHAILSCILFYDTDVFILLIHFYVKEQMTVKQKGMSKFFEGICRHSPQNNRTQKDCHMSACGT